MAAFQIIRAEHAGACYGVQRAIDMAYGAADQADESVCTLGQLIHNPGVVADLEARGISVAATPADVTTDGVVIRSHGIMPETLHELEAMDLDIIDATCPYVKRAQQHAVKLAQAGNHVLVVGEAGHPEVDAIAAYAREAGGQCTIVAGKDDIPADLHDPVGVVVQTTQPQSKLVEVVDELQARGLTPEVKDTICFATQERQQAASALASTVDAMVVLGGRNSSNTTRLYEICCEHCTNVHHIETVDELDPAWFAGCERVGVSAGASTPEDQIAALEARLAQIADMA